MRALIVIGALACACASPDQKPRDASATLSGVSMRPGPAQPPQQQRPAQ